MAVTDDLTLLLQRLHSNQSLIAQFQADPDAAVQNYELTPHERDAVVTRDLDDFVALGVVNSIEELPAVLRGLPTGPPRPRPSILETLRRMLDRILVPHPGRTRPAPTSSPPARLHSGPST
jgi:hypothetical protein